MSERHRHKLKQIGEFLLARWSREVLRPELSCMAVAVSAVGALLLRFCHSLNLCYANANEGTRRKLLFIF